MFNVFNVIITHKSGKIERTQIKIGKYAEALKQLTEEKGIVSMIITGVE